MDGTKAAVFTRLPSSQCSAIQYFRARWRPTVGAPAAIKPYTPSGSPGACQAKRLHQSNQ
eukprot:1160573-Pelagomonas_calceolata.AAC.9